MPFAIAALALTAIGTAVSVKGALDQGAAAKEANQAQSRLQDIRVQQQRYQQIRESRAKAANILQEGANVGAGESSSVQGGAASVTQAGYQNQSYITMQGSAGQAISKAQQKELDARGLSAIGSGISSIGGTAFNNRHEIQDIFS